MKISIANSISLPILYLISMFLFTGKLEVRLLGEISTTSDMQMTPPLWQKAKKN